MATSLASNWFRWTLLSFSVAALLLTGCSAPTGPPQPGSGNEEVGPLVSAPEITELALKHFGERKLQAAIGVVLEDGKVVAEFELGEAMTGVPARIGDSWRNGAIAIAYMGIALLRLDEQGVIDVDATIERYLPDLPAADTITPRDLITMTSGIPDYVPDADFEKALNADPFRAWTADELINFGLAQPRMFKSGTNWDYSHTGIVVLGEVMSAAAGKPLAQILQKQVLDPAQLTHTFSEQSALLPGPALHGYTAERGIYEDASFWNPSWTLATGAVQTSTVRDAAKSFDSIVGRGELLSDESYATLIARTLVGFGEPLEGCRTCHTLDEKWAYGFGVFLWGDYVAQTPIFGGYSAAVVTLPAERAHDGRSLTIAVAATLREDAVENWRGTLPNRADELAVAIATMLRPDQSPPPFTFSG